MKAETSGWDNDFGLQHYVACMLYILNDDNIKLHNNQQPTVQARSMLARRLFWHSGTVFDCKRTVVGRIQYGKINYFILPWRYYKAQRWELRSSN